MKRLLPLLLLIALSWPQSTRGAAAPWETGALAGRPAPEFNLSTTSGEKISLADLKGRTVLLNFWATWCGPCRNEMPSLNTLFKELDRHDFIVVGIAVDQVEKAVGNFLRKLPLDFPNAHDPAMETARRYKVFAFPTSFLIDPDGIIREIYIGERDWSAARIRNRIGRVINRKVDQQRTPGSVNPATARNHGTNP